MVPIAVVDRPGWRLKALASKAARTFAASRIPKSEAGGLALRPAPAWTFLTGPLSRMSSTELRNTARRGGEECCQIVTKQQCGLLGRGCRRSRGGPSGSAPIRAQARFR